MILFPPAKINLGLNVKSKRSDGYHEIETCMVEVPFHDVLEILPSTKFKFISSGMEIKGNVDDNLCVKAYRLLESEHNLPPVYIHLRKNIPMGAGLGGGSSDATYVLKGLNELFDLELDKKELERYASVLGSDCAFFVKGGSQIAIGRGEVLSDSDVDLKGKYLKLINPEIHIGTAEAYSNVVLDKGSSVHSVLQEPIENWQSRLNNSFESYAFSEHPEIKSLKDELIEDGAIYVAMSGSGSSVFGIYESEPKHSANYTLEWIVKL